MKKAFITAAILVLLTNNAFAFNFHFFGKTHVDKFTNDSRFNNNRVNTLTNDSGFSKNNINELTNDYTIKAALNMLQTNGEGEVLNSLSKMHVKLMFYDFSKMGMSGNYYAMKAKQGRQLYIVINRRYKNSPTEAIACLIAHEIVHKLPKLTFHEEETATTEEAQCWTSLKKDNSYSSKDALINRLNDLSALYLASTPGNDLIKDKIANSSFYRNQLAMK